jgi:hypothetical protein
MAVPALIGQSCYLNITYQRCALKYHTARFEIGMPGYLINATLLGVMAQRDWLECCSDCKQENKIDE